MRKLALRNVGINDISNFWNNHPLGSYEESFECNLEKFFDFLDKKRSNVARFARNTIDFDKFYGKRVLELGCGPGWNVKNFAKYGSDISACDITQNAVNLTKSWLKMLNLNANICIGNVESAPFRREYFDYVVCDGVLHHTPEIEKGLKEIFRMMKPDSKGLISVYYENVLLRGFMFFITKCVLWILRVKFLGGVRVMPSMSKEEFGRLYDGKDNVLGKIYSRKEITHLINEANLKIKSYNLHFFPTPFIPCGKYIPKWIVRMLEKCFGTLLYIKVTK